MSQKSVEFGVITETWMQPGKQLQDITEELEHAYSLSLIARCRGQNAANGRTYGGVVFVYRRSRGSFREFVITNPNDYEVLATVGKVCGIKSDVFCLLCSSQHGSLRAGGMIEYVSDLIAEAKRLLGDVLVLVSGDFNQWPVHDILQDHPDMAEVNHGPTRQHRSIDRSFTNFNRSIMDSGCGAEHLLVRLWQDVLEAMEDPRAAVLLTSIDFAKAFNRLDFNHCLQTLKNKGVTSGILKVISSFLSGRTLTVKVGNSFSTPRPVLGGVPQGSLLGVFLFNCSIHSFEATSDDVRRYLGGTGASTVASEPEMGTPVPDEPSLPDYRHLPLFMRLPLELYKYVDDNVILENFDYVPTDGRFVRTKRAIRTENLFIKIVHQAVAQGMKVNAAKTKALLISELKSYAPRAFFNDNDGGQVRGGETMCMGLMSISRYTSLVYV